MDISVIIVSWNTKELLRGCLQSLQRQVGITHEVFVVDNNSIDGSTDMVRKEFPHTKLIANSKNIGFAAANNQALRIAKGELLLLLNPDTLLEDQNSLQLVSEYQKKTQAGIVGCHLLNGDGTHQDSVRSFPTPFSQACIMLKIHAFFPNLKSLQRYFQKKFSYEHSQPVDQVSGAFFSISKNCRDSVGDLDENFWIWFEEVDYCLRAKQLGFETRYFSGTHVIHFGGQSFQQIMPFDRQKKFNRSILRYAKKHFSFLAYVFLFCIQPVSLFLARCTPSTRRLSSYD